MINDTVNYDIICLYEPFFPFWCPKREGIHQQKYLGPKHTHTYTLGWANYITLHDHQYSKSAPFLFWVWGVKLPSGTHRRELCCFLSLLWCMSIHASGAWKATATQQRPLKQLFFSPLLSLNPQTRIVGGVAEPNTHQPNGIKHYGDTLRVWNTSQSCPFWDTPFS